MSQNGPHGGQSWSSNEGADPPYSEPADPWGENAAPVPDPAWTGTGQAVPPATGMTSGWTSQASTPPLDRPRRRNTPMIALVVALGVLVAVGLGVAGALLNDQNKANSSGNGQPSSGATATQQTQASGNGSASNSSITVKDGDCVNVEKSSNPKVQPKITVSVCASGNYKVLKVIRGKTTGDADAQRKCADSHGYTNYFYNDSPLDDLDYVLCLQEYKS